MEEESWASCGNCDYLTPWDLSSLSTKSSPMLSLMLGVEGEDGPSCNSWSSSLMCMNFYFNFQNRTYTETLLHCEVHDFFFPMSPYSPKIDSEQESYVHFIPELQSVPNFRTCSVQSFCHISLYGSSNSWERFCHACKTIKCTHYPRGDGRE